MDYGKMQMELNGEKRSIIVEEYESFGEPAFKLILEKSKWKRT